MDQNKPMSTLLISVKTEICIFIGKLNSAFIESLCKIP